MVICKYYNTPNGCKYGKKCKFEHVPRCKYHNTPNGCRYGDNCKFEHIDDDSDDNDDDDDDSDDDDQYAPASDDPYYDDDNDPDSDPDELSFVMRKKPIPIRCCAGVKCGNLCYYDQARCSKPRNNHKLDWDDASCNVCDNDVDNDSIEYPEDWPYPGYIWLKYCPHCGVYLHGGLINCYGVLLH